LLPFNPSLFLQESIPHEAGLYRMLCKSFPHAIYYQIFDEIASVVTILPMTRDPALAWPRKSALHSIRE